MKFSIIILIGLLLSTTTLFAQKRTITGVVKDMDGVPIFAVSVFSKDHPEINTRTDSDGKFELKMEQYNILAFTAMGYEPKEILIISQSEIEVTLSDTELDEVVITAVAIERQEKEIGFAFESLNGDQIIEAREPNVLNALAGRVPGLNVSSSGGSLGGSSYINIRGTTSISGSNQPLFVVDGFPIDNSNIASLSRFMAPDFGNRGQDLNSDDIKTITVLKGPAAAILYGSRAANGAIIITTKKGRAGGKAAVSFNTSFAMQDIVKLPKFQNQYGQGSDGKYQAQNRFSWGPKMDGREVLDHNGKTTLFSPQPNNIKNFFDKGSLLVNNVSVDGGSQTTGFRFSITDSRQKGVVPGSTLNKNVISASTNTKLSEKISGSFGVNYVLSKNAGRPLQGFNNEDVLLESVYFMPRNLNVDLLRNHKYEDGKQNKLLGYLQNPFWTARENKYTTNLSRLFGFGHLSYRPIDWIEVSWRVGLDSYNEQRKQVTAVYSNRTPKGAFWQDNIQKSQINSDLIATFTRSFSESLKFKGLIGLNLNENKRSNFLTQSEDLSTPDLYNVSNAKRNLSQQRQYLTRIIGTYFDLGFVYNNYLYVNLTGRNDWNSTLPKDNRSFFYPALSTSFIFTEAFEIESEFLSFGKIRANIANAGNGTEPYLIHDAYEPLFGIIQNYGQDNYYPWGPNKIVSFASGEIKAAGESLKPERVTSWEVGTDIRLWNGRVRFDLTYYNSVINDQIINLAVANSTGYKEVVSNSATIQNAGIELVLGGHVIAPKKDGFGWEVDLNYSQNKNTFSGLSDGRTFTLMPQSTATPFMQARVGQPVGSIVGTGWKRNENGEIIVNPQTGMGEIDPNTVIANIQPDFRMGMLSKFSFKGFTLSTLIDWKQGGKIYSQTTRDLQITGNVEETANRDQPYIIKGVLDNGDGTYSPNNVPISPQDFWTNAPQEEGVFDASYIKLRELSLLYSFSQDFLERTPFSKITIGLVSRNLFILHDNIPHIDPEVSFYGSTSAQGMEVYNLPGTRSYGFTLMTTF